MARGLRLVLPQLNGRRNRFWLTIGYIFRLGAGLAPGTVIRRMGEFRVHFVVSALKPMETIWLDALWMIVLPFMVSLSVVAIVSTEHPRETEQMRGETCLLKRCAKLAFLSPAERVQNV
jgi:Na+/H+-dicarboxylate symporter